MRRLLAGRCPLCAARALEPTGRGLVFASGRVRSFALACAFCGLLLAGDAETEAVRAHLHDRLGASAFLADEAAPYGLDVYTLRIAATARRRGVLPIGEAQAEALRWPHAGLAAAAELVDLAPAAPSVSLGILCRPDEIAAVAASLAPHAAWTDDIVLLADDASSGPVAFHLAGVPEGTVRRAARPLGDDFAGQRNALQALSRHDWMLQLDADETIEPQTAALLAPLVRMADAQEVRSIGLPRRNLLDGVLSDLYPDTQYRLNHRSIRYAGRVHERPDRPWQQSLVTLHGAILHHLGRAHVETRSRRYEAIAPGRGRLEEAGLLLRPYRD